MEAMINDYRSDKFTQLSSVAAAAATVSSGTVGQPESNREKAEAEGEETSQNMPFHGGGGGGHAQGSRRPCHLQFADNEPRFISAMVSGH